MKRFQCVLAGALSAAMLAGLLLTGASAADFAKSKTYTAGQFTDVPTTAWYHDSIKTCYELGLMNGISDTAFAPGGLFTRAQAVTVAARLHHIYAGGDGVLPNTYAVSAPAAAAGKWYSNAVGYCVANGIITADQFADFDKDITRAEMAAVVVAALPEDAWNAINDVTELPDVSDATPNVDDIFTLYNAGIMGGSDEYGTYQPYAYITRAEVAAVVTRCAVPAQRKLLNLTPLSQLPNLEIPGTLDSDARMVDGRIPFKSSETGLYGYLGTQAVAIAPRFEEAGNFSNGYALVEMNDKYGIIDISGNLVVPAEYKEYNCYDGAANYVLSNGNERSVFVDGKLTALGSHIVFNWSTENQFITGTAPYAGVYGVITSDGRTVIPCEYQSIAFNGYFYVAEVDDASYDIYSVDGVKTAHYDGYVRWANNSPLLTVKEGSKYALASGEHKITEAYYDEITLYENSELARIKYGKAVGMASLNGEILAPGEMKDVNPVVGNYARVWNDAGENFLVSTAGIVGPYTTSNPHLNFVGEDYYIVNGSDLYAMDGTGVGSVSGDYNYLSINTAEGGTEYYLFRGDYPDTLAELCAGEPYTQTKIDKLYINYWKYYYVSLSKDGENWVSTADMEYAIRENEAGKPVVSYGNDHVGWTPVIEFYKNSMNYDEIKGIGEGYYACRFNTTWYLLHA